MNFLHAPIQSTLDSATFGLEPPFAAVDLDAFDANLAELTRRAGGVPLRLASKSLRVRTLEERAMKAGFRGVLCFTLSEALWLAELGWGDLVVGYPTVDRAALRELALSAAARERVTVMVDCVEHLDLIAAAGGDGPVKVCIDVDAGWRLPGGRVTIGPKRSPLHDPCQVAAFAREVVFRPEVVLDGLMAYEGQIAGVGDRPPGRPLMRLALPVMQALSARELAGRRALIVDAVRVVAPVRFVNGGGTGSIERTAAEPAVTEVAAGLRALRTDAVRHLPRVQAAAGGVLRAAGGAQAFSFDRHGFGRRLHRVRRSGARSVAFAVLARGAEAGRLGGGG